jgi:hypothetical protein
MLEQAHIFTAFGTVGYSLSDTVSRTSLIKLLARRGAKCSKIIPGQPETGLGLASNGEGVFGLRRALAVAGSAAQVISLWRVSDRATAELMSSFYRYLKSAQRSPNALRSAQLAILAGRHYSHPYYWAAFASSGSFSANAPAGLYFHSVRNGGIFSI